MRRKWSASPFYAVTGRDYSDLGSIHSQRKRDVQSPSVDRDAQRMEPRLASGVTWIFNHEQPLATNPISAGALPARER
jgi:hypothetical protein